MILGKMTINSDHHSQWTYFNENWILYLNIQNSVIFILVAHNYNIVPWYLFNYS
jgi:hypothetical protein